MKRALLLAFSLSLAGSALAEHPALPLTVGDLHTLDGRDYKGAVITGIDNLGVKLQHDGGLARVLFESLPDNVAAKFADSAAEGKARIEAQERVRKEAAEQEEAARREQEAKAALARKEAVAPAPAPPVPVAPVQPPAAPAEPPALAKDVDPEVKERIADLKAYIARLERGIDDAQENIERLRAREDTLRRRADYYVYDGYGNGYTGVNGSVLAKADFVARQATREAGKIREAEQLIRDAREKIGALEQLPAGSAPQSAVIPDTV